MTARVLLVVAALGALGVALALVLILVGQRALIFPGSRAAGAPGPEAFGGETLWLDAEGARTEAWFLPAHGGPKGGPLLVYAHGNGELIDHWVDGFEPARAAGASVLLVEYPGYGRSGGSPSEGAISASMRAAYDEATRRGGFSPERVVGWGRSLGGGAVCALARERQLAALVLESTFTSLASMAERLGLPRWLAPLLLRDRFDNVALLRDFAGPVLLLHGERDEIVSPDEARANATASGAPLHWLPCGHNDCARPWPLVLPFLAAQGLLPEVSG